jgi:hypothetical protein
MIKPNHLKDLNNQVIENIEQKTSDAGDPQKG